MADRPGVPPEVLHRDQELLVVAKPAGMPTTSPESGRPCLVDWVSHHITDGVAPHPTSRLDSPVSGAVTFALTSAANQHLLQARRLARYTRTYLGITLQPASLGRTEWSWPISIDPRNPKLRVAGDGRGRREAHTVCEVAAQAGGATLLRLRPQTGRTHQIRVHASRAGLPLFGDHAYGGARRSVLASGRVVAAGRVMLHCARVRFPRLRGDDELDIVAPVPDDFARAWSSHGGALDVLA
ncbi:MAG: RluA family pseudouridine synthase [Myxococcota bacterium]